MLACVCQWVFHPGPGYGQSAISDEDVNIFSTGAFNLIDDCNGGPDGFNLTASGNYDVHVAKTNAFNNLDFAAQFVGDYNASVTNIITDTMYIICVCGYKYGSVDFDPGPPVFLFSAYSDYSEAFILKLTHEGEFIWAINLGGSGNDFVSAIKVNSGCEIFCTCYFNNTADVYPEIDSLNITYLGYEDFL